MKKRWLIVIIALVFTFGLIELLIGITDLDTRYLWPTLYYVEKGEVYKDNVQVFRHSDNAERLYELRPGVHSKCINCPHPQEIKYDTTDVYVNTLGFRDREHPVEKADSVYRIIVVGGSNTYGGAVSNEDTYPYLMEGILDSIYPGQFEVWNAGLNAYQNSQKIAYARQIMEKYDPDMLILQEFNSGRRAFYFDDQEYRSHFKKNHELYRENLPLLIPGSALFSIPHYFLVDHWRFYRFATASFNSFLVQWKIRHCQGFKDVSSNCIGLDIDNKFNDYGSKISHRETARFLESHNDVPIIRFDPVFQNYCEGNQEDEVYDNVKYFSLCDTSKSEEYYHIHPPSYVYKWYAKELTAFILDEYLLHEK